MAEKKKGKAKKPAAGKEKGKATGKAKVEKRAVKKEKVVKKKVKEGKEKVEKKEAKEKVKEEKVEKKGKEEKEATKEEKLRAYSVIRYPLITEKAVNMIEAENKLVFIVEGSATKQDVRKAVETLYGVKVDRVNILRDMKSRKRALVKVNKKYKADDIATKLGIL